MEDMKLTKKEKKESGDLCCSHSSQEYPWGLSITLEETALKKLGIKNLPEAGEQCRIKAIGIVTSVSSSASDKEARRSISIQITELDAGFDSGEFDKGFSEK